MPFSGNDLEGVCQSPLDQTIWIVEERRRELVQLDSLGTELSRKFINVENNEENSGLEGAAIEPVSGARYIANEKNPAQLIRLDAQNQIDQTWNISFIDDCSGLAFEPSGDFLWIVSDESKSVVKCDSHGSKIASYSIDMDKAKGIAVSVSDSIIYIVSDSQEKLYKFKIPN